MGDSARLDLKKCYEVALDLVKTAGQLIVQRNDSRQSYVQKSGEIDLVTETDKEVEKLIIEGIRKVFPKHDFIGEEGTSAEEGEKQVLTDAPTWIIDPVDGTMNFVHAFPHSCISVGFMVNKQFEIGIIFNPLLDQLFTGRRGKGAFFNGRRIHVTEQTSLEKALITSEFGTSRDPEKMKIVNANFATVASKAHGIRVLGSAALNMAMVALGGADANYEFGIHAWDVCAATVLVREAGGVVIDPAGGDFDMMSRRVLAASSMQLAKELSEILTQYYPQPRDD